jgi:cytosine/adenosine deaminase-related metal-dependent hydrolase
VAKIVSKSPSQCEYCESNIPSGTEIEYESQQCWHPACHTALKSGKLAGGSLIEALRSVGLEREATEVDEGYTKARTLDAACQTAEAGLERIAPRVSSSAASDVRAAIAALRATVPASIAKAAADREAAQRLLGAHLGKKPLSNQ